MTRVTAPSRLHFGLLNVPNDGSPDTSRRFGGVGLMIDRPGIVVTARPAEKVRGFVLIEACRYFEFQVRSVDDSGERVSIEAEVVHTGRQRDFWGFNRAKHAVLEAAILATRMHLIPHAEIAAEFQKLLVIVNKTGGPAELEAMNFLESRLQSEARP